MSLAIDPDVLLDSRRVLLRHEAALTSVALVPPDTGETADLTAAALARVSAVVDGLTADLRGLADALAELVADLERSDEGVSLWFDLLRAGSLA